MGLNFRPSLDREWERGNVGFIDDLSVVVDLLVLVAVVIFYTGFLVWFHTLYKKDSARAYTHLRQGGFVLALLGGLIGLFALWGEFVWPLTITISAGNITVYNVFFFDPLILLSLLLVSFGAAVWFKLPTHFVGVMAIPIGGGVIYYGYLGYQNNLTLDHLETYLLFLVWGTVAIASYGATLFVDWFVIGTQNPNAAPLASSTTPAFPRMWTVLIFLFLVVVVLAGVAAIWYGQDIAWGHLQGLGP